MRVWWVEEIGHHIIKFMIADFFTRRKISQFHHHASLKDLSCEEYYNLRGRDKENGLRFAISSDPSQTSIESCEEGHLPAICIEFSAVCVDWCLFLFIYRYFFYQTFSSLFWLYCSKENWKTCSHYVLTTVSWVELWFFSSFNI